jgi:alcohol dehydrogenase
MITDPTSTTAQGATNRPATNPTVLPLGATYRFDLPTSWRHGRGIAATTGTVLRELGCGRPLLLTDRLLIEKGVVAPVVASLEAAGLTYTVCDGVTKEPTVALLDELLATIDLQGFDSVVAVGGGSVIDVAKAVALLADFGGHIRDYSGQGKVPGPLSRPLITVPTTAGTGSEISDGSVWVDEAAHTKFLVLSTHICPTVALTDPEMTRSMPPSVTGLSGVDALTHAVESYVSRDASPASELFSLRALGLIAAALPAAYRDGDNLDARETQQLGATMAMIGGMNAHMGLCHAMAMPLCGLYPIPHGLACGLTLPHVLAFNAEAVPARVAAALAGMGIPPAAAGEHPWEPYRRLSAFLASVGVRVRLADLGYTEDHLELLVRETRKSVQFPFNPRAASDDELAALIRRMV